MKKFTFWVILTLAAWNTTAQKLSPDQLKTDFEIFRKSLEETHPGLYRFTAKQWFDSAFNNTVAGIHDSLIQKEFYRLLAPLVAKIKCGHIKFFPQSDVNLNQFHYFYDTARLFPFKLLFGENQVWITGSYGKNPDHKFYGARAIAINGTPLEEIKNRLLTYIPADGNTVSSKYEELNNYFPAWYANFIDQPDTFHLDLQLADNSVYHLRAKPVNMTTITGKFNQEQTPQEPNFSLSFPEEKIALMKIRAFYPLNKDDNYKAFLKESFGEINDRKTEHLILDLRNNEGGMDRWGALLYSYLTDQKFGYYKELRLSGIKFTTEPYLQKPKLYGILKLLVKKKNGKYYWTKHKNLKVQKPQKNPFKGKVYILLNGRSYSVTAEFAAIAKSNNRALFFGQETGGTYEGNNSGTFAFVNLPNSGLTLAIPMLAYHLDVKPVNPMDRGIIPDYSISPVPGENNQELKYVLDYINGVR